MPGTSMDAQASTRGTRSRRSYERHFSDEQQLADIERALVGDARLGSSRTPLVSVVIPTLDEAANLPHVLPNISYEHEIVIVDGGSKDRTIEVALELRPDALIVLQRGRGKGDALSCGFAAANGDIIVMLDADGSALPSEIDRFVEALMCGADFAKGSRNLPGGGSADISPLRQAGNRALSGLVNLLFGTDYTDLCYGYNAFWARCLPALDFDCPGFEVETMLNIRARQAALAVVEVPSYEECRIHGETHLRTFRDGWRVLRTILRERRASAGDLAPMPIGLAAEGKSA